MKNGLRKTLALWLNSTARNETRIDSTIVTKASDYHRNSGIVTEFNAVHLKKNKKLF